MTFKIGEFSKLAQVTVKTLRHYEEVGLLIPVEVDEWTGYPYYDIAQLKRMTKIVYWKQWGFSLEEIAGIFGEGREHPDGGGTDPAEDRKLPERDRTPAVAAGRTG